MRIARISLHFASPPLNVVRLCVVGLTMVIWDGWTGWGSSGVWKGSTPQIVGFLWQDPAKSAALAKAKGQPGGPKSVA